MATVQESPQSAMPGSPRSCGHDTGPAGELSTAAPPCTATDRPAPPLKES